MQLLDGSVVPLDQHSRGLILEALNDMSSGALRCLGFAYKDELPEFETYDGSEDHPAHELLLKPSNYSSIESGLTFVGLVGLRVSRKRKTGIHAFCFLFKSFVVSPMTLGCTFLIFSGSSSERGLPGN